MFNVEKAWETVIAVLLAASGGLARLLYLKDRRKMKWGRIFSELFISGFSGLMMLMLIHASGISGDWVGVVCGMSGWIGPKILEIAAKRIEKTIGIETDDKKNDAQ